METINCFLQTENLYLAATRVVSTRLENLNDDFKYNKEHNPIHQIQTRVKTPKSIIDKLIKRGYEATIQSARKHLTDIAGVRVICSYIEDIYLVANLITSQDDIKVIRVSDYIKDPKSNGYRSFHLIVTVPVFLSTCTEYVNVEIQLRTIAMDFWASLEHHLYYKYKNEKNGEVAKELKDCAEVIANTDMRMQLLHNLATNTINKIDKNSIDGT
ncbi:MAG: GTP pyrophosphokinase family protein [Bacteroidales bacterium]